MIPGIVKVGFFSAYDAPDSSYPVLPEELSVNPVWVELAAVGSITEESNYSPLDLNVKSELAFSSSDDISTSKKLAFIAVDAQGEMYLIGNRPPHCGNLKKVAQINEPSGKASVFYYTFSLPFHVIKL